AGGGGTPGPGPPGRPGSVASGVRLPGCCGNGAPERFGGRRRWAPGWHAGPVDDGATDAADKPPLVISACLLGVACNHEGRGSPRAVVDELAQRYRLVPVCPEVLGGLPTPRAAAEITGGDGADVLAGPDPGGSGGARVVNVDGED